MNMTFLSVKPRRPSRSMTMTLTRPGISLRASRNLSSCSSFSTMRNLEPESLIRKASWLAESVV